MSKLMMLYIAAVVAMICFVGQQPASACVTQGLDEYVADGCGDSACTVQICSGSGGGHIYPIGSVIAPKVIQTNNLFLAAADLRSAFSPNTTFVDDAVEISFLLGSKEQKSIPTPDFVARGNR